MKGYHSRLKRRPWKKVALSVLARVIAMENAQPSEALRRTRAELEASLRRPQKPEDPYADEEETAA